MMFRKLDLQGQENMKLEGDCCDVESIHHTSKHPKSLSVLEMFFASLSAADAAETVME